MDLLFRYASPYCDLLLDGEIFERLRGECELSQDLLTYRTWGGSEGEQPIDARFTPGCTERVESCKPRVRGTSTFCDNTRSRAIAALGSDIGRTCIRGIDRPWTEQRFCLRKGDKDTRRTHEIF